MSKNVSDRKRVPGDQHVQESKKTEKDWNKEQHEQHHQGDPMSHKEDNQKKKFVSDEDITKKRRTA